MKKRYILLALCLLSAAGKYAKDGTVIGQGDLTIPFQVISRFLDEKRGVPTADIEPNTSFLPMGQRLVRALMKDPSTGDAGDTTIDGTSHEMRERVTLGKWANNFCEDEIKHEDFVAFTKDNLAIFTEFFAEQKEQPPETQEELVEFEKEIDKRIGPFLCKNVKTSTQKKAGITIKTTVYAFVPDVYLQPQGKLFLVTIKETEKPVAAKSNEMKKEVEVFSEWYNE